MTQACTFRGTFDQAWQVSHHEALLRANAYHAKIGVQRGERIVGNARPGIGNSADQGRFTGIRHAQQSNVSQHLEFQLEALDFTRPAGRFLPWRTIDGALEAHVAEAAVAALGNGDHVARRQQFIQHFAGFGVGDDGADRHLEDDVGAHGTEHVRAHAVLASLGRMTSREAEVDQRVQVDVGHCKDVAATAAVAAIGAAKFLVLLMAKRHATVAPIAGGNVDKGFVDELHELNPGD